jgi:hypothetical protein
MSASIAACAALVGVGMLVLACMGDLISEEVRAGSTGCRTC